MTPLILPHFNQPTYLRNALNWWRWYRDDPVFVLDNGSPMEAHLGARAAARLFPDVEVIRFDENTMRANLTRFLAEKIHPHFAHYVISDPDIMPHPGTPPDFLDVFQHVTDAMGYHHAGFGLIARDLPSWIPPIIREDAERNESGMHTGPVTVEYAGRAYVGHRVPIDTTFALYRTAAGGWSSPMPGPHWSSSMRLFEAFHLGWFLPEHPNAEMTRYFESCEMPKHLEPVTGTNTYRPAKFYDRANALWQAHFDTLPADIRAARVPPKEKA